MQPVLTDLSKWQPFGLPLHDWALAHWPVLALVIGLAFVGVLWLQSRSERLGRPAGLGSHLASGLLVAVVAGVGILLAKINSYGLMLALGFLAAIAVARWRAGRCGESPKVITNLGILSLIGGVVGARLSFVVEHYKEFDNALDVVKVTSGGLVFDGGLILAALMALAFLRWRKLPVRRYLDIIAVSAMIGLAFGRVGCFLNGCCYGGVCKADFALGVRFPYAAPPVVFPHAGANPYPADAQPSPVFAEQFTRSILKPGQVPPELLNAPDTALSAAGRAAAGLKAPAGLQTAQELDAARHARSLPVQPAQLYGIANALVLAAILSVFFRLRNREGQVFALLFVLYPIARIVLEVIRDDNPGMALTPAQWKCLVLLAVGVVLLLALRKLPASCGPTWNQRLALAQRALRPEPARPRRGKA